MDINVDKFLQDSGHNRCEPLDVQNKSISAINQFNSKNSKSLIVIVLKSNNAESNGNFYKVWDKVKNYSNPIFLVLFHKSGIKLCFKSDLKPPIVDSTDFKLVEKLCDEALKIENNLEVSLFLKSIIPTYETDIPGINNNGFVSTYELKSENYKYSCGNETFTGGGYSPSKLGFTEEKCKKYNVLKNKTKKLVLEYTLDSNEIPELESDKLGDLSPVEFTFKIAQENKIPWIFLVKNNKKSIRLYSTKKQTNDYKHLKDSYIECTPSIIPNKHKHLINCLLSTSALKDNGIIYNLIENSKIYTAGVADNLRDRIYNDVIPILSNGVIKSRKINHYTQTELDLSYEIVLTILFRILFIAYAEDNDLFPYKRNANYKEKSLKQLILKISNDQGYYNSESCECWKHIVYLFKVTSLGEKKIGLPRYNGTLFSSNKDESKVGYEISRIKIKDKYFVNVLKSILLTKNDDNYIGPIDFRSLSVKNFGTIYEGLLESSLSLAQNNLIIKDNAYIITKKNKCDIKKGEVYLHNQSGKRKSTGSYYTNETIVKYFIENDLERAINKHLAKVSKIEDDKEQGEMLFNFHLADISMGSGHFIVSAIDKIEDEFGKWLSVNKNHYVINLLSSIKNKALQTLSQYQDETSIDNKFILKRMVARKCCFGVEINPIAVLLARLSVWTNTFVPGLPMSMLDNNLQIGNSLIGIGTKNEIREYLSKSEKDTALSVKDDLINKTLNDLKPTINKLNKLNDTSYDEIVKDTKLHLEIEYKTKTLNNLCNLIIAQPISNNNYIKHVNLSIWKSKNSTKNQEEAEKESHLLLKKYNPFHFPTRFPEVFINKNNPGFDVIVGNPPWDIVKVNEKSFYSLKFPGLGGLSSVEYISKINAIKKKYKNIVKEFENEQSINQEYRKLLHASVIYKMGGGDPDLYKAFSWRFLQLINSDGILGIVFPNSITINNGSLNFRKKIFDGNYTTSLVTLINKKQWIFDIGESSKIVLLSLEKKKSKNITFTRLIDDKIEFINNINNYKITTSVDTFIKNNVNLTFPLLVDNHSYSTFKKYLKHPNINDSNGNYFYIKQYNELHDTKHRGFFKKDYQDSYWKIYKGKNYNLWEYKFNIKNILYGDPLEINEHLFKRRLNTYKRNDSIYNELCKKDVYDNIETLTSFYPKIVYRTTARSTDQRTVIACLIPPKIYHLTSSTLIKVCKGSEEDEAFLLGVISSIPFDWYAKKFINLGVKIYNFGSFPIPRPNKNCKLRNQLIKNSGRLAASSNEFRLWADSIGVKINSIQSISEKENLIYENDALVALLYGLNKNDLVHIFKTFHNNYEHEIPLKETLKYYKKWNNKQ